MLGYLVAITLAGVVLFFFARKKGDDRYVSSASDAFDEGSQPDFRPRDANGKIAGTLSAPEFTINPDHPARRYRVLAEHQLESSGKSIGELYTPYRNFLFADKFDKAFARGGLAALLTDFPDRVTWEQIADALYIVRADEYHKHFKAFIEADSEAVASAISSGSPIEQGFSRDWDELLRSSISEVPGGGDGTYMERRLDFYCDEGTE